MTYQFNEFVDKKQRDARKQLAIVQQILEKAGFNVSSHIKESDPYLFVKSQENNLSFEGVRVYKIGSDIAYRIQKREDTHPYGKAYSIPIEQVFEDLLGEDDLNDEEIGKKVALAVTSELKEFFNKNYEAEKNGNSFGDPLNKIVKRSSITGTTYSDQMFRQ